MKKLIGALNIVGVLCLLLSGAGIIVYYAMDILSLFIWTVSMAMIRSISMQLIYVGLFGICCILLATWIGKKTGQ